MFSVKSAIRNLVYSVTAAGLFLAVHDAPARADGHQSYKGAVPAPSYLGWYVEGRLGGLITDESEGDMESPNVAGANGNLDIETDGGFGGAVSVGKYFKPRWRAEVDWSIGETDDIKIDYSGAPANPLSPATLNANGDITINTVMFNVFRSWNRTFFGKIRPYNGIGIGFANIDVDNVAPAGSRFIVDDDDTVFVAAYHSGFDVEVSERTSLVLRLSTMWTEGGSFSARDTLNAGGIMTFDGDSQLNSAVTGGLRIRLN